MEEKIRAAAASSSLVRRLVGYEGNEVKLSDPFLAIQILAPAIATLPERLRDIVAARYGEGLRLDDAGRRIGVSKERARQLEAQALRKLRAMRQVRERIEDLRHCLVRQVPAEDWLTTRAAAAKTGLTTAHLRYLGRTGRVRVKDGPRRGSTRWFDANSLREYVTTRPRRGRKKGVWHET